MVKKATPSKKKSSSLSTKRPLSKTKKVAAKTKKKVSPIPKGYNVITPYLIVKNAEKAITFYKKAFLAKEVLKMAQPSGRIGHAELKLGDSKIMLADECKEMGALSPQAYKGAAITINFYTKNVDEVVKKAVKLGAKLKRPVEDMFYGDRCGTVIDPFGHIWHVSTHIEDVSRAELKKRAEKMFSKNS